MNGYPHLERVAAGRPLSAVRLHMELEIPTTRRGLTAFTMRLDRLTEDMIETFCYGSCAVFAGAIHEASGWPIALIEYSTGAWAHVGVSAPNGDFVDIRGAHSGEEVLEMYGRDALVSHPTYPELRSRIGEPWRERVSADPQIAEALLFFARKVTAEVRERRFA